MSKALTIELPDDIVREIGRAVAAGEYKDEKAAVSETIADWRGRWALESISVKELRQLWDEGLQSGAGNGLSIEEIKKVARN